MATARLSATAGVVYLSTTDDCPYCTELLGPDMLHVCPAGCCYVDGYEGQEKVVCPYCEEDFRLSAGHICLELIALTTPVQ